MPVLLAFTPSNGHSTHQHTAKSQFMNTCSFHTKSVFSQSRRKTVDCLFWRLSNRVILAIIGMSMFSCVCSAQTIINLQGNGRLSWTNNPNVSLYKIQWASRLPGSWRSSWSGLDAITPTGTCQSVDVPMFYRLVMLDHTERIMIHPDVTIANSAPNSPALIVNNVLTSTNTFKFGPQSLLFAEGSDMRVDPISSLAFRTNAFSVSMWINFNTPSPSAQMIGMHTPYQFADWLFSYDSTEFRFYLNSALLIAAPFSLTTNRWYHLAVTRTNDIVRLFIDGHMEGVASNCTYDVQANRRLTIGSSGEGSMPMWFNGYMEEIRVNNGAACWASDFTPPTERYP